MLTALAGGGEVGGVEMEVVRTHPLGQVLNAWSRCSSLCNGPQYTQVPHPKAPLACERFGDRLRPAGCGQATRTFPTAQRT